MIHYLSCGIKFIFLKFFGRKISVDGIPAIELNTDIRARDGKIKLGHKMSTRSNVHICANEGGELTIGKLVFFNYNCIIVCKGKIQIGDGTVFGPNVSIFDHNHRFDLNGVKEEMSIGCITIGKNCWIGAGSIILKGANIGDGCIIGAGTIVSDTIPAHSIVTMDRKLRIQQIEKRV